MGYLSCLD